LSPKKDNYQASAYYLQLGYRANSELAFTVRHEGLEIPEDATLYQITGWESQTRNVIAMNYRFEASNALRIEANKTTYTDLANSSKDFSEFRIQWFFLIL